MPTILSPPANSAKPATQRSALFGSLFLLLGVLAACSHEPMTIEQTTTVTSESPVRVLVTLAPSPDAPSGAPSMKAAVKHLQAAYPNARVLRTMPAFSQLLIELPDNQLDALTADSRVLKAQPDASHQATQSQP